MDLMGEIVITESMVTSMPEVRHSGIDNNFTKATRQLRKLTDELQEVVMSIRMVPISTVFQKMNRIVRDMSRKLDRPAQLVLVGEDTEVDKTIVDCISDPIMHLVRNGMDHGIESREEREKASKPPSGRSRFPPRIPAARSSFRWRTTAGGSTAGASLAKRRKGACSKSRRRSTRRRRSISFC